MPGMYRLLTSLILLLAAPIAIAATPIDRILVVVNESVILKSDFDAALHDARNQLRARGVRNVPETELRDQVLERLVLMRIQTDRAREAGIRVDDRELNDVMSDIARRNNMTLSQFAEQIRAEGSDYLAVREQVREEIISQRLRARELEPRINVTESDVDAYLAQQQDVGDGEVRLSHILVAVRDGASPDVRREQRAKVEELRQRLQDGEAFSALAAAHSDGQQALDGGDLGWRRVADLPPVFARAVSTLDAGGLTDVVESSGGFHLLQVEDRRGGEAVNVITETRSRHILVAPDELMDEEAARALIQDIARRLEEGESFSELARRHSTDPGSRNDGGDLGWQPPGTMVDSFERAAQELEPGERSRPFRSQFGWHIVEVMDRRERDVTRQMRRQQARQSIGERKLQEEYELWLRRLRDEAFIEYRLRDA